MPIMLSGSRDITPSNMEVSLKIVFGAFINLVNLIVRCHYGSYLC